MTYTVTVLEKTPGGFAGKCAKVVGWKGALLHIIANAPTPRVHKTHTSSVHVHVYVHIDVMSMYVYIGMYTTYVMYIVHRHAEVFVHLYTCITCTFRLLIYY